MRCWVDRVPRKGWIDDGSSADGDDGANAASRVDDDRELEHATDGSTHDDGYVGGNAANGVRDGGDAYPNENAPGGARLDDLFLEAWIFHRV